MTLRRVAIALLEEASLSLEKPLPPYAVLDVKDEPIWLFDTVEAALQFIAESVKWGFSGDILAHIGTLTPEQKKAAREVIRG